MLGLRSEFRRVLEECLGRIAGGEAPEACLAGYPQHASRLQPYLESASALRGMKAPEPAASARQEARRQLLDAVSGVEDAPVPAGGKFLPSAMLRLGSVGAALAMFMVAAIGASAFFGGGGVVGGVLDALKVPNPIAAIVGGGDGEDESDVVEFTGQAVSVSQHGVSVNTGVGSNLVRYVAETEFEWESGEPASAGDVHVGMELFVRARPIPNTSAFDGLLVRILDGSSQTPTPTAEPTATPEPEPTSTPEPVEPTPPPEDKHDDGEPQDKPPAPKPEPSVCTEVAFEGKIMSVGSSSFTFKTENVVRTFSFNSETVVQGYMAAGVPAFVKGCKFGAETFVAKKVATFPMEFWATVVSASGSAVTVKIEGAGSPVTLHRTSQTEVIGPLYVNIKVTVKAYKKADGSFLALRIAAKTADFSGTITAKNGSTYTVVSGGTTYTVKANGETVFVGSAVVGAAVTVKAYKMGDGTFLAYKLIAEAPPAQDNFTGVLVEKNLEIDTIWVKVEGQVREVCIEFADVIGTLNVGVTVKVYIDHTEGGVYFASLVKVIS
jgi:hypothetical protein